VFPQPYDVRMEDTPAGGRREPAHVRILAADCRLMPELADGSVDLVVTSPPYWQIKDYGHAGQIGQGHSLHAYLADLYSVWRECFRVQRPGTRLCVNIGDQFARASVYGRYKVIPLHAEIVAQGETAGFDYMGSIIWRKRTTMNTSGGAVIMGSYPYPPNGVVELDYEFILLFRKPGKAPPPDPEARAASALTKEEWKQYFTGHWSFGGIRQSGHEAMFPMELPRRLIRMFSFAGDTVLDPFLGSGTTALAALELGRHAVGYEIKREFVEMARGRINPADGLFPVSLTVEERSGAAAAAAARSRVAAEYQPRIMDALPGRGAAGAAPDAAMDLHKVTGVKDDGRIELHDGRTVSFQGVRILDRERTRTYLQERIAGKKVFLRDESGDRNGDDDPAAGCSTVTAYVFLKNRIFVNARLISSGMADPDGTDHRWRKKFEKLVEGRSGA
jgi:modification methylase